MNQNAETVNNAQREGSEEERFKEFLREMRVRYEEHRTREVQDILDSIFQTDRYAKDDGKGADG